MQKPSWLFWSIALFALAWSAFGVVDYWMTTTGNEKYLQDFDPEMIEWITGFPAWRNFLWMASVAAGLVGAVALLLRRRVASLLFLVNFVTMLVGFVGHDIVMANGVEMYGPLGLGVSTVIVCMSGVFWWYANRSATRGVIS